MDKHPSKCYYENTKVKIHDAPTREGYDFLYWKGSEYQPGDAYTVIEDHKFVAQWQKKSIQPVPVTPDNPTPAKQVDVAPKTGDVNHLRNNAGGHFQRGGASFALKGENMKEIAIQDVVPVRIGQVENTEAGTGCTVFLCPEGMRAGLDVRGGGPASRESQLLDPRMAAKVIHGIVLAGGSAFGLGAASGVQQFLEEQGVGFDVGVTKVPLVAQSDLFDLTVGDAFTRPDEAMGYAAAKRAWEAPNYQDGNFGAGCGATVGKIRGMNYCIKTGVGSYAIETNGLRVGAVVALNALGDIRDYKTGKQIAGPLNDAKNGYLNTLDCMTETAEVVENRFAGNTTLAVVLTNAAFDKAALCKIAGMGHDGYARSIAPVHTTMDGDSIYAVSVGDLVAEQDVVGALAADVISEAIVRAVQSAESAYGFPSAKEIEL